jgi:hypothetical protein
LKFKDEEGYVSHESQENFQKDPKEKEAGIKISELRKVSRCLRTFGILKLYYFSDISE